MLGEREQRHEPRGRNGHRGSMSDMTSVLHQSVVNNSKGGYCWLFGLVVNDVNP
jgi:hypothetical protein